jgi:hypothetical protein
MCAETASVDAIMLEFFTLIVLVYSSQIPTELGDAVESDSYRLSPWRPVFSPLPVHARFTLGKVGLGKVLQHT